MLKLLRLEKVALVRRWFDMEGDEALPLGDEFGHDTRGVEEVFRIGRMACVALLGVALTVVVV